MRKNWVEQLKSKSFRRMRRIALSAVVFVSIGLLAMSAVWAANFAQLAKLTANDAANDDSFGARVAVSGDTVVVGAPGNDLERGSAYVFVRSGAGFIFQQKLTASDGAANDV